MIESVINATFPLIGGLGSKMRNVPIIIAGSGRSGTTWILDSIAEANGLGTIFEPLHHRHVPTAKQFANRYIRADSSEPKLRSFMEKIFTGNLHNMWANYRVGGPNILFPWSKDSCNRIGNSPMSLCKFFVVRYMRLINHYRKYKRSHNERIIVKFIRANLMLEWIAKNFNVKILFVVRHPAAVISSCLNIVMSNVVQGWDFEGLLQKYKNDVQLNDDFLHRYDSFLQHRLSIVSSIAVIWCIENMLPIVKAQQAGHHVVFYEDLIVNPESNWEKIIRSIDVNSTPSIELYSKPSQQASKYMKKSKFDDSQITRWQKYLNKEQLIEIEEILKNFNVSIYNVSEPMPVSRTQNIDNVI